MNETIQVALIVSTAPTLIGLGTLVQSLKIHTLVNSNMTAVKNKLEKALTEIVKLKKTIADGSKNLGGQ